MGVRSGRLRITDLMLVAGLTLAATMTGALANHTPAANVNLIDPSIYSPDNRSSVFFNAVSGQTNNLTVSLTGSTVVLDDSNVSFTTSTPDRCVITNEGHTASCTPTGESPPVPYVVIEMGDLNDTLVNNAAIPSSFGSAAFFGDGGPGDDDLTGSSTPDSLFGGLGSDTVHGLGGNDSIRDFDESDFDTPPSEALGDDDFFGGEDDDALDGGAGSDEIRGENGTDSLAGGTGNNILDGGSGIDEVAYQIPPAFDPNGDFIPVAPTDPGALIRLNATASTTGNGLSGQNDTIVRVEDAIGTQGMDNITGSPVGNVLLGVAGNDAIVGGLGADTISGGGDADSLDSVDRAVDRVDCGGDTTDSATVDAVDQILRCSDADLTVVSARAISLNLRRHLIATGVLTTRGYRPCISGVPVRVQKRVAGRWSTIKSPTTTAGGSYTTTLNDRRGTYRALAPAVQPAPGQVCTQANSSSKVHRH